MDIRIVESLPTSGTLADSRFRIDPIKENVSLEFSYGDNSLTLMDYNLNYGLLPYQLGNGLVKKCFLTYNGVSNQTNEILETVLMESGNTQDPDQAPGFINSNEWIYYPANFNVPAALENGASVDLLEWGYPYTEGVTLIKQFLNSEGHLNPPLYTAYYRQPTMTNFELANVEGGKVYIDGWYSSYMIAVKTYNLVDPTTYGIAQNQIIFNETDELFYINTTGDVLAFDIDGAHLPENDTVNWTASPTFEQWMNLLRENIGGNVIINTNNGGNPLVNNNVAVNNIVPSGVQRFGNRRVVPQDPVFYIESQHLATPILNKAILTELKRNCSCCHLPQFNMTHMEDWVRLTQKRLGAFINFNEENFKDAQCIIQSTRTKCNECLYHKTCTSC